MAIKSWTFRLYHPCGLPFLASAFNPDWKDDAEVYLADKIERLFDWDANVLWWWDFVAIDAEDAEIALYRSADIPDSDFEWWAMTDSEARALFKFKVWSQIEDAYNTFYQALVKACAEAVSE